ncbi:MAG: hypothetical protein JXR96_10330 [Deltaproteobacteria bacterium]|nr:hypothetical protein [Deltaproteobacteria bacterium]
MAVFDLEVKGTTLDSSAIDRLTDYLGALLARKGFKVVPRSQLKSRLTEAKKGTYRECYDESCQIEIGKELAAQKSLASQVLKIGMQCKVTVNLFDLKTAASDGAGAGSGNCDEDGIVASLEKAVADLLSQKEARERSEEAARMKAAAEARARAEDEARRAALTKVQDVKQPGSGLYWLRCPLGQTWSGSSCVGKHSAMSLADAREACPPGYRLPRRHEFVELLGGCDAAALTGKEGECSTCDRSARCSSLFGKDDGSYWSSSSYASDPSRVWGANFAGGYLLGVEKVFPLMVRCVRQ